MREKEKLSPSQLLSEKQLPETKLIPNLSKTEVITIKIYISALKRGNRVSFAKNAGKMIKEIFDKHGIDWQNLPKSTPENLLSLGEKIHPSIKDVFEKSLNGDDKKEIQKIGDDYLND